MVTISRVADARRGAADRGEHCEAAGAVASLKQQAHRVLRPVGHFVANGGLELLLFCGIALQVKLITFPPRLTTFHASGVPRLTMFCASVAPRLTTLLLTGLLFLTLLHTVLHIVLHTGHWLSGRCWSGWLRLSLSI